jgi:hypothetical protein
VRRPVVLAAISFAVAALAPAAQARTVYVRHAASAHPEVWAARDGGGHRVRLGEGTMPAISADGARAAWRSFGRRDAVWTAPADGSGRPRRVVRTSTVGDVALSPDGTRLGVALPHRLAVYDAATRAEMASLRGRMRGFAFSADAQRIVFARATSDAADAHTDLFTAQLADGTTSRLTTGGRSLNPTWGPAGTIAFDRARPRHADAPVFQVWALDPGATSARRITHMRVPSLLSGLVPLELSADDTHLLAEFEGQDTSLGYTVDMTSGRVRALSRRIEQGFVAADLSSDGDTVLGTTGSADPGGRHDVVTVPFRGGRPAVLVRDAMYPRWSR